MRLLDSVGRREEEERKKRSGWNNVIADNIIGRSFCVGSGTASNTRSDSMTLLRPTRPAVFSSPFPSLRGLLHYHRCYFTMSENQRKNNNHHNHHHNRPPKDKKPQLTHFLCLPLVNSVSLSQLESSLATFRAAIPPLPPTVTQGTQHDAQGEAPVEQAQSPLIPDGALRPLGTLHLTLGVMSLPTKERLEEALELFQSLDLAAMMHEAENKAQRSRLGRKERPEQMLSYNISDDRIGPDPGPVNRQQFPQPLNISLESLHALPRARSATVLHAVPVDPTSRLYPFCEMLRDKFLEAGFIVGENKGSQKPQSQAEGGRQKEATERTFQEDEKDTKKEEQPVSGSTGSGNVTETALSTTDIPTKAFEELPVNTAEQSLRSIDKSMRTPKPKPKPLLLHATVVNTIYVKGRWRGGGSSKKHNKKSNNRYTFDAQDILNHYRDYYLDSTRTTPRSAAVTVSGVSRETPEPPEDAINTTTEPEGNSEQGPNDNTDDSDFEKRKRSADNVDTTVKTPFVWARNFPLDSVCICEMGAKKLDPSEDAHGLNARLGEKYRVIAERSLAWDDPASLRPVTQTVTADAPVREQTLADASSDISLEGGVKVSES